MGGGILLLLLHHQWRRQTRPRLSGVQTSCSVYYCDSPTRLALILTPRPDCPNTTKVMSSVLQPSFYTRPKPNRTEPHTLNSQTNLARPNKKAKKKMVKNTMLPVTWKGNKNYPAWYKKGLINRHLWASNVVYCNKSITTHLEKRMT